MSLHRINLANGLLIATLTGAGCATVDPRADFDRTAAKVSQATGQKALYRPGEIATIPEHIEERSRDGITVDEAVDIALLNNPRLQAAFMDVGVARAECVQSGLLSNPSLFSSVRFPDSGGLANIDFSLAQNFADLWLIPPRRRAAHRALDRAILELARQASLVAVETREAYYEVVSADGIAAIAEENRAVAQQLLDAAEAQQQAGTGNLVDINLSRSEMLDTELALRRSRLNAFESRRRLATLLGWTLSPVDLRLIDSFPAWSAWTLDVEGLVDVALANRLDLQAADRSVEMAQARLQEEERGLFKSMEVGLAFERVEREPGSDRNLLAETARSSIEAGELELPPFRVKDDNNQDTLLGPSLSLDLPIFDQNQAQIAKAKYLYEQAVTLRHALATELGQDVRLAFEQARTWMEISEFFRDQVLPLRAVNLELSRDAYRTGTLTFLSVLEAQRALLNARSQFVEAQRDAAKGLTELERSVGLPWKEILGGSNIKAGEGMNP